VKVHGTSPATLEQKTIFFLCLLTGLHVFIYGAAFPFFNNVDEPRHFDLVLKYSRGDIPRQLELVDRETAVDQGIYGANFYLETGTNEGELLPQPWKLPAEKKAAWISPDSPLFQGINYESSQPPLYYAAAAAVWRLLGDLGIEEGRKLYLLHFLNIPVVILIVWLGWLTAKVVFPDDAFPRIALPAFIACMPQSAFYSIQNDVLSPLCFGSAFFGLLLFFRDETVDWRLGVFAGLSLAASFLTKMTNVPLLAISALALAAYAWRLQLEGKLRQALPAFAALAASAVLPALLWIAWCRKNFGDFTGSYPKVLYWGWTPKPFLDWFQHPIFTVHGAWTFLSEFLSEFWQGEMSWHYQALCLPGVKAFYDVLSIALLLVVLVRLIRRPAPALIAEHRSLRFAFFVFAAGVGFLVYISIRFDFHNCAYPSRGYPYVVSGRLALGALIPFMLLFVSGLDQVLARAKMPVKFLILTSLLIIMLIAEFATNGPAFYDEYNWYHF